MIFIILILSILSELEYKKIENWRQLWKQWKNVLSVEKVTMQFFEDYKKIFFKIKNYIINQHISKIESHEFTLQLLNRIMFLYFITKKKWLNNNPKFISWFWNNYLIEKKSKNLYDIFYSQWLSILFFDIFNNRFDKIERLPASIRDAVRDTPFLNGGLFKKSEIDKIPVTLGDELFKIIFKFFEKYNFTIREDLIDEEVAVDPQIIGYVYESLANVAEEVYKKEEILDRSGEFSIHQRMKLNLW